MSDVRVNIWIKIGIKEPVCLPANGNQAKSVVLLQVNTNETNGQKSYNLSGFPRRHGDD
jgi:hypothetical protein